LLLLLLLSDSHACDVVPRRLVFRGRIPELLRVGLLQSSLNVDENGRSWPTAATLPVTRSSTDEHVSASAPTLTSNSSSSSSSSSSFVVRSLDA
jgi:hypothetical protein